MPKITEHFSLHEFDCHSGDPYPANWIKTRLEKLCDNLEVIREALGEPMTVNSGYRTPEYNRKIGGALNSQHVQGRAADFTCKGKKPATVARIVRELMDQGRILPGGIGIYPTFVHYDVRGFRASWTGNRKNN